MEVDSSVFDWLKIPLSICNLLQLHTESYAVRISRCFIPIHFVIGPLYIHYFNNPDGSNFIEESLGLVWDSPSWSIFDWNEGASGLLTHYGVLPSALCIDGCHPDGVTIDGRETVARLVPAEFIAFMGVCHTTGSWLPRPFHGCASRLVKHWLLIGFVLSMGSYRTKLHSMDYSRILPWHLTMYLISDPGFWTHLWAPSPQWIPLWSTQRKHFPDSCVCSACCDWVFIMWNDEASDCALFCNLVWS